MPKNNENLKNLMKSLQNETIQIDIKCYFDTSKTFSMTR